MSYEFLLDLLGKAWEAPGVQFIIYHVLVNLVAAVAAALKNGGFELAKLGEFLYKKILPLVLTYYVVLLTGESAGLSYLAPIAFAAIEATLIGDLADSWVALGLPFPKKAASALIVKVE